MRIVCLAEPAPDNRAGHERLGPDDRVDRAALPAVLNGNDEYAVELALRLVEADGAGGEVVLLAMAPPACGEVRPYHAKYPAVVADHLSSLLGPASRSA